MGLFGFDNKYPYTDFHELNLDWILSQMIALRSDMKNFVSLNTIKYADPIQWNITTQYMGNTVVIDPATGNAYISTQAVPAGVSLSDPDYWAIIGNFSTLYDSVKKSIAAADDGDSLTATAARNTGELVWLGNVLYKVLSPISIGALYIKSGAGQNVEETTIEDLLNAIDSDILTIQGDITDIQGDIADLPTIRTDIAYLLANNITITPEGYGAIGDGVTDDTNAFRLCMADGEGKVIVLTQNYLITDMVEVPSNCQIIGLDGATVIDAWHIVVTEEENKKLGIFYLNNKENIVIKNIRITGNTIGEVQSDVFFRRSDIGVYDSKNVTIDNVIFDACDLFTQIWVEESENITITNCKFNWYRYQGILCIASNHLIIDNNFFSDCGCDFVNTYGITFNYMTTPNISCRYVDCSNNTFIYPNNTANWESIDAHGITDAIINDNIIDNGLYGIVIMTENARNFRSLRVSICNNRINNCGAVGIVAGGTDFNIENNTLTGCGGNIEGIGAMHFYCRMEAFNVANNMFYACKYIIFSFYWEIGTSVYIERNNIHDNFITSSTIKSGTNDVDLLSFDHLSTAQIRYNNYFKNNVIHEINTNIINIKTPTTRLNDSSFFTFSGNTYTAIPKYNSFKCIAPDLIEYDDRNSLEVGERGHVVYIGNFTNTTGTVAMMIRNESVYAKLGVL